MNGYTISMGGEPEANGRLAQDVLMELDDGAPSERIPSIKTILNYCYHRKNVQIVF
jgi:hypothetical protein